MPPSSVNASLDCLIQLHLPAPKHQADRISLASANAQLRKKLQSLIFFPPESEPSWRETRQRWNGVLERRRVENHGVVAEELERCDAELEAILKSGEGNHLSKSLDGVRAFLLELHSPPSLELYLLAHNLRQERQKLKHLPSQAELDAQLYRSIIESEPLAGDHWQTDIYAGSSSSFSGSTPSSDWNSSSEGHNENNDPDRRDGFPKDAQSLGHVDHHLSLTYQAETDTQNVSQPGPGLPKLEALKKDAYWLDSDAEKQAKPLPELIAVREVISALLNIGGQHIYTTGSLGGPVTLSAHVPTLLHKSSNASISLFSSFLPLLSSLKKLRTQSLLPADPTKRTNTEEAFSASLLDILKCFDMFLTSIELRMLNLPSSYAPSDARDDKTGPVISLMRLYSDIVSDGWSELLCALALAIPDHSPTTTPSQPSASTTKALLDKLYSMACHFDFCCNTPTAVESMKMVFLKTSEPVWKWIGDWILNGRLPRRRLNGHSIAGEWAIDKNVSSDQDSGHVPHSPAADDDNQEPEFFIEATSLGRSWTSGNWWQAGYILRRCDQANEDEAEDDVPTFLEPFKWDILEGGKARALLKILGAADDPEGSSWPTLAGLMELDSTNPSPDATGTYQATNGLRSHLLHPFASRPALREPQPASFGEPTSQARFHLSLFSQIKLHITPLNARNHSRLHIQFSSSYKLSSYLEAMNEFFLIGSISSGLFVKKVMDDMDDSMNSNLLSGHSLLNSTDWWDDQVINVNLSKAFENSPVPIMGSCLPKIRVTRTARHEADPIKCFEAIQVGLTIPTPLNYVLDSSHVLDSYNRAFVFLAQLAWAGRTLDSLLLVKPHIPFGSSSGKAFEQQQEARAFYRLRNRLGWFVNLVTDYSMNLVVQRWKRSMAGCFDTHVSDLSEKIREVRRWMSRLMTLMFLSEQCELLHRAILQLFQLCSTCHKVWTAFNRQANALVFIRDINEEHIDTERRRRRTERRRRRIAKEQCTLIEEESRIGMVDEEEDGSTDHQAGEGSEEPGGLCENQSTMLPHLASFFINHSSEEESFLEQLGRMNEQFEKLMIIVQRGVGKLSRRAARGGIVSGGRADGDGDEVEEGGVVLPPEDVDVLTLLECRLEEWII